MGKMGMTLEEPTIRERLRGVLTRGRRRARAAHREFVLQRTLRRIRSRDLGTRRLGRVLLGMLGRVARLTGGFRHRENMG